jgi:hypothetical protein
VLDGVKTGMTILPERYKQDRENRHYGTLFTPRWKMDPDCLAQHFNLPRGDLPPFVMDLLRDAMDEAADEQLRRIANQFATLPKVKDHDLVVPWEDAVARAQTMLSSPGVHMRGAGQAQKDALEAIKTHVERVHSLSAKIMASKGMSMTTTTPDAEPHAGPSTGPGTGISRETPTVKGKERARSRSTQGGINSNKSRGRGSSGGGPKFTNRKIESRQDQLRWLSREFVGGPPADETLVFSPEEVARLRASYAYVYDWGDGKYGGTRFPWNVAMRELGEIKLRARKDFKPISQDFYEKMSMRRKL